VGIRKAAPRVCVRGAFVTEFAGNQSPKRQRGVERKNPSLEDPSRENPSLALRALMSRFNGDAESVTDAVAGLRADFVTPPADDLV